MSDETRRANRLAQETSAYLRQHQHNPVDWYPWGPEAFARARAEGKPLLVSIGYSACHWCHVMERESFEDPATAELMNRLFVNVKVDREERPDVDRIYMDFVVRTGGQGGWPLTVFCTPEGRPFYGGTYFPPAPRPGLPSFRQVLEAVAQAFEGRRAEVEESAARLVEALSRGPEGESSEAPGSAALERAAARLRAAADRSVGGFGEAPKFPTPTSLDALLAAADFLPGHAAEEGLEHVWLSCREMSRRGLYDHLGGGFHRYCVDAHWRIPHFEKMLYDQGQLIRTYVEAWRRSGGRETDLLWPVEETLAYLRREMAAPDGGFFASQDADSEGVEGRFYVWTPDQVKEVLGEARGARFCEAYGVTEAGNFEGGASVLSDLAREPREVWRAEREALRVARAKRVPPATDRKRVASWNAYLASGLARAAGVLGDAALLAEAEAILDFIEERMTDAEGRLLHVFDEGRARVGGLLEDVAAVMEACLDVHRAGGAARFLERAFDLAEELRQRFFDPERDELFLTASDAEPLPWRPRAEPDGATPNAEGQALLALLRAATLSGRATWSEVVDRVLRRRAFLLERVPEAYLGLARTAAARERGLAVAVVVGPPDDAHRAALAARARSILAPEDAVLEVEPGAAPAGIDPAWLQGRGGIEGRAALYLCRGTACSPPIERPEDLTLQTLC